MLLWASPAPLPSRHRGFFFGRLQPVLLPATMGCPQTTRSHRTLEPRMYKKIIVPVDLSNRERLEKTVAPAADLSTCYNVHAEFVAVTAPVPVSVPRHPEVLSDKLSWFSPAASAKPGIV